jgi:hypothetical protein
MKLAKLVIKQFLPVLSLQSHNTLLLILARSVLLIIKSFKNYQLIELGLFV